MYPLSLPQKEELDKFLDEHLAKGTIVPSKSPQASDFFFLKKKDGSLHLVQYYRYIHQ
jgi:hypothetical protein